MSGSKNPLICALIGGGIAIAVIAVVALLFPLVALKFGDPKSVIGAVGIICALLGGMTGGFISAKMCGEFMVRVGLMSSGIAVAPLMCLSLVTVGKINFVMASVIIFSIVSSSLLGAYFVMKMNQKNKHNMKKVLRRKG